MLLAFLCIIGVVSSLLPPSIRGRARPTSRSAIYASSIMDVPTKAKANPPPSLNSKVSIVGGGPAGLATAIMLARRGYMDINVYDRLSEPPAPDNTEVYSDFGNERSYSIGVNGRGQLALGALGVLPRVENFSVECVGRLDWTPQSPIDKPQETLNRRKFNPKIIQRDRLTACLLQDIREKYNNSVAVSFNTQCVDASWKQPGKADETCILKLKNDQSGDEWTEESTFVIGADGAQSAVRSAMEREREKRFFVKRYEDKNVRVYRTIPLHIPAETKEKDGKEGKETKKWRRDLNYSARTKSDINIDALPTKEGVYFGVVLYRPWDERMKSMKDGNDARAFFNEVLPMFSPMVRDSDLEAFAKKGDSKLPKFSYAGPVLHKGRTTCLVGDCIHTVKPYFGVGVNSAFEDVINLNTALDLCHDNVPAAVAKYSSLRAKDAAAIVQMSRKLDGGFFTFVLPLIVDSILHKKLPFLFSPNTIAAMQNPEVKFSQVQARKRLDRVLQVILFSTIFGALVRLFAMIVTAVKMLVVKIGAKRALSKIPSVI